MLKRNDPMSAQPESIGELFGRAKDEAKAWAQSEVALYKTIGVEKANAWKTPVILFVAALFLAHMALLVLIATLFVALAQVMNPALAGVVTFVILLAAAGILAKVGQSKLKGASK